MSNVNSLGMSYTSILTHREGWTARSCGVQMYFELGFPAVLSSSTFKIRRPGLVQSVSNVLASSSILADNASQVREGFCAGEFMLSNFDRW